MVARGLGVALFVLGMVASVSVAQGEADEPKFAAAPEPAWAVARTFVEAMLVKVDSKAAAAVCTTPFLTMEEDVLQKDVQAYLAEVLEDAEDLGLRIQSIEISEKTLGEIWEGYPEEVNKDLICRVNMRQKEGPDEMDDWDEVTLILLRQVEGQWRVSGLIVLPWF